MAKRGKAWRSLLSPRTSAVGRLSGLRVDISMPCVLVVSRSMSNTTWATAALSLVKASFYVPSRKLVPSTAVTVTSRVLCHYTVYYML